MKVTCNVMLWDSRNHGDEDSVDFSEPSGQVPRSTQPRMQ